MDNHKGRFKPGDPPLVRFERKYIPEPNSGCWLWFGATNEEGYGCFISGGRNIKAAHAAWVLYRGIIPSGLQILHRCDNPACVNPDHLFPGTQADNVADMMAKGRGAGQFRATPANAKLTPEEVLLILHDSRAHQAIARQFNVSPSAVWQIKKGRTWRSVTRGHALDRKRAGA